MVKSFRFLLRFTLVNLGAIVSFIAAVIVGCYATGVPDNPGNVVYSSLFVNYYTMLPTFILLCLLLYAMALCTNNLNLGLSMGARRGDFFWAIQGIILFYTAVCWAIQWLLSVFPMAAGWTEWNNLSLLANYAGRPWIFPLLCITLLVLGCLLGLLMVRHSVQAAVVLIISCLMIMGTTILMLLSARTNIVVFLTGTGWEWIFTTLPRLLPVILIAVAAGGELLMWRAIQNYTVR